ncbi:S-adenosyl-L-methionine-dependent methyltransferase [Aspergillus heteromorphus CBS 117.55]|uniref:S-adenosyl-L-methionine-dependent methyltransferase n=1 Tax=Aspergillus heteromorphus CBS 117.55 TaxID=1448321 RepID=A0A317W9F0_9EURO|nr:S-adenosyl-L-methionine-dependent methyltransferase [Aspergillus heteromorphus CBS 117.55]PWY82953.1 S-adenosyl-L-methionine-dependent methyltransferase [Aspergillus heteromorphus CBS 117.55]
MDVDRIAISPNAPDAIPALIDQISSSRTLSADDPKARLRLRDAARSLANALETPRDAIVRHRWSEATGYAAILTAIDLGLFGELGVGKSRSVGELAVVTKSDPVLLSRISKHLAAMEVITETGPDEYTATNLSTTLSVGRYADAFSLLSHWFFPAIYALPSFLQKAGYRNPSDITNSAFQLGHQTEAHFFQCAQRSPTLNKQFNNHMSVYHQGRPSWMDHGFYPVEERLVKGVDISTGDVFLVDIGGSTGHDLCEFRPKWPHVPGCLVLQDLPKVVAAVEKRDLPESIEVMAHDFFMEQPVRGARAYYMHSVLHDWPDDMCRKILSRLLPVVKPGYSKVLINENVAPSRDAHYETTSLDMNMLSISSGERTERHWTARGVGIIQWDVDKSASGHPVRRDG